MAKFKLDDTDHKILDMLIENTRTPFTDIAKKLNISAGTVHVRVRKMEEVKLTESQFTKCAVFLVLCEYALPQLTKWNADGDEDKFQVMMSHYRKKYESEFNKILEDGVEYDHDNDGTVEDIEKQPFHSRRLVR